MLNRIRVRGKLLLLLTAPLLALVIFAYLGIINRLDTSSGQTREEHLAQLADSGSDLGQAVAHGRLVAMMVDAGSQVDATAPAAATRDAMKQWLERAASARGYINSPTTVDNIDQLTVRLQDRLGRGDQSGRSATSQLAELSLLSRSIQGINNGLLAEAADLGLYRAMFVQSYAGEMQNAATEIAVVGANSIRSGEISTVSADLLDQADRRLSEGAVEFQAQAEPKYVSMLAALRNAGLLPRAVNDLSSSSRDLAPFVAAGDSASRIKWLRLGLERVDGIHGLSERLLQDASLAAANKAALARDSAKNFMVLAGSVSLVALLMAVLIGRSISRPLVHLSRSARQLSDEELPALVESMRTGGRIAPPEMTPIESKGRDEVAQLSHAISEIQKVTMAVAEEQTALLHRGISAMFVNLARRNQSLLDRQIQFIDSLEVAEEDPDQLEHLFELDHLATRMRRNAESLLVLAGAEPSRRRGKPVELEAVIRVAISEIEAYSRVDLVAIDESLVPSTVAIDLAHLASELMENATQFSPPESRVDAVGHRTSDGTYRITISDHGLGMTAEQIVDANRTLAEPPILGLDLGRSLGFTVIARIADRLGLTVRLTPTPQGGLTAVVSLPTELLVDPEPTCDTPAGAPSIADDMPSESDANRDLFEAFALPPTAARPTQSLGDDLFAGLSDPPRLPDPVVSTLPPPPSATDTVARSPLSRRPPNPVDKPSPSLTRAGLVRRNPGQASPSAPPRTVVPEKTAASSGRSPDEIREMLSRYRGGLLRGHVRTDANDPSQKN